MISFSSDAYKTKTYKSSYIPFIKSGSLKRYGNTDIYVTPKGDIMIYINHRYLALCNSLLKDDPRGIPYFVYNHQKVYPHIVVLHTLNNTYDNILKKVTYKDGLSYNFQLENITVEEGFPTSFAGQILYLKINKMLSNVKIVKEIGTTISVVRSITERDRYNHDLSPPYNQLKQHYRYIAAYKHIQNAMKDATTITLTISDLLQVIGGRKEFNGKNSIDVFRTVTELSQETLGVDYVSDEDSITIFKRG